MLLSSVKKADPLKSASRHSLSRSSGSFQAGVSAEIPGVQKVRESRCEEMIPKRFGWRHLQDSSLQLPLQVLQFL